MRQSLKLGVVVLTALLIGGVFLALPARSTSPVRANAVGVAPAGGPPALIFNRSLKSTSFSVNVCCQTATAGFFNIDSPVSFTCPGPGNCTVSAEMWAQAGGNSTAQNRWALVALVDGSFIGPGPFAGELLTDGLFSVTSWTDVAANIPPGHHTLQSQIYTDFGATLANANVLYRLYKP